VYPTLSSLSTYHTAGLLLGSSVNTLRSGI
jgi:hypothetical protein